MAFGEVSPFRAVGNGGQLLIFVLVMLLSLGPAANAVQART